MIDQSSKSHQVLLAVRAVVDLLLVCRRVEVHAECHDAIQLFLTDNALLGKPIPSEPGSIVCNATLLVLQCDCCRRDCTIRITHFYAEEYAFAGQLRGVWAIARLEMLRQPAGRHFLDLQNGQRVMIRLRLDFV